MQQPRWSLKRAVPGAVALALLLATVPATAEPADTTDTTTTDSANDTTSDTTSDTTATTATTTTTPVHVNDPLRVAQWYLDRIRAPEAWARTMGDPDVVVAIVDTGVDPGHPDLFNRFWQDPVLGTHGYDHLRDAALPWESPERDWHGTAVAGVLGAGADDSVGIAGVAPLARIQVQRIYASENADRLPNQTDYPTAVAGIEAAVASGADVILLTWGGTGPSTELARAVRTAGVPVVAAAGNDGQDLSGNPLIRRYPAMYRYPNLVTVAATDLDDFLVRNDRVRSNYGARHVDIAAPGDEIISTVAGGGCTYFEGTSFAAPQVAGALALGRVVAPGMGAGELIATLNRTARQVPSLQDRVTSGGVLDIAAFLEGVERPACGREHDPAGFGDVVEGSTHAAAIDCIFAFGLTRGVEEGVYAPARTITRGEMAAFLARTLDSAGYALPEVDPADAPFDDVAGTTHELAIAQVAALELSEGYGDGRFGTRDPVTRGQMATFLVNLVDLLLDGVPEPDRGWFDDVAGTTHETRILIARELGITLGSAEPRLFEPDGNLTRAQMASFLGRTLDALGREGVAARPVS